VPAGCPGPDGRDGAGQPYDWEPELDPLALPVLVRVGRKGESAGGSGIPPAGFEFRSPPDWGDVCRRCLRMGRILGTILFLVYLAVGLVIAANHHYFTHLGSIKPIVSAVLAVVLWPLVLGDVNLHIK